MTSFFILCQAKEPEMKKKELETLEKKLRLSRETLRNLESSEAQKVLGAVVCSPVTASGGDTCIDQCTTTTY